MSGAPSPRNIVESRDYSVRESQDLLERAKAVEALISANPALFFTGYVRVGGFPLFAERASGAYVWDVDGNRYIDFILGYGSVVLGHAEPSIVAAVEEALRRGCNPTLLSVSHVDLAERIIALSPGAELVTFLKTGSDATGAAVRLARATTGRQYVLQWGLHGWHDWCARNTKGVLDQSRSHTLTLDYNDLEHAEELFSICKNDVACVIMMPYEIELPKAGYLQGLRDLCRRHGAVFILDEIRSGFRIAIGGAQEYFDVEADLVTYGKAMANGHPISALAGRKRLMKRILDVAMTVTYYRTSDGIAAALATINEICRRNVPAYLSKLGHGLKVGIDRAAARAGVRARMIGHPATPFIEFDYQSQHARERAMRLFCNGMLRRGILLSPAHHWFLCASMQEHDIAQTVAAAQEVFDDLNAKL